MAKLLLATICLPMLGAGLMWALAPLGLQVAVVEAVERQAANYALPKATDRKWRKVRLVDLEELETEVGEMERRYASMQQELNSLGQQCIRRRGALDELRSLAAPEEADL